MTEREQFEGWWNSEERDDDWFLPIIAWEAWHAATAAERERAAKVADSMNTFGLPPDVGAAIREGG